MFYFCSNIYILQEGLQNSSNKNKATVPAQKQDSKVK